MSWTARSITTPTFDMRGGNGPTRVMAIDEDVLVLDRPLDQLHRRIEALDMTDHERHAGAAGGRDNGVTLLDRRSDRLFHHDVDAATDAFECQIVVKVRGGRDGDRIDAGAEQSVDVGEPGAAEGSGDEIPLLAIRIRDASEMNAGDVRQHPGMIAAHDADADYSDLQWFGRYPDNLTHAQRAPLKTPSPTALT